MSQATLVIYKMYIKMDHPSLTHLQPERRALVVVSQVVCHKVVVEICGTYSQSINVYMVMVLASSVEVKV
jgi:hypothetical protein